MSKLFSFKNARGLPEGMANDPRRASDAASPSQPVYIVGDDVELQHFHMGESQKILSPRTRSASPPPAESKSSSASVPNVDADAAAVLEVAHNTTQDVQASKKNSRDHNNRRISFDSTVEDEKDKQNDRARRSKLEEEAAKRRSTRRAQSKRIANAKTCTVCEKEYTNPKTLPCNHTFCLNCIQKFVNPKNNASCPTCHKEHKLPNGNAATLPTDPTLSRLLDKLKANRAAKQLQSPAPTPSRRASASVAAAASGVKECSACHVALKDDQAQFCSYTQKYFCVLCFDHHVKVIRNNLESVKEKLSSAEGKVADIQRATQVQMSAVDAAADRLLEELTARLAEERAALSDAIAARREKSNGEAKAMEIEIKRLRDLTTASSEELTSGQEVINRFVSVHSAFMSLMARMDEAAATSVELAPMTLEEEDRHFALTEKKAAVKGGVGRRMSEISLANGTVSAAPFSTPSAHLHGHSIQPKFNVYGRVHTTTQHKPTCAVICPWTQDIFVCVPDAKVIEVFDFHGDGRHPRRVINSGNDSGANLLYPYRLAFGDQASAEVFVLDKWKNSVLIMDEASGIFGVSWGGSGQSAGHFQNPCGICFQARDGLVLVADTGNDRVQVLDRHGKFIRIIGGVYDKGVTDSELSQPEDVAVSPDGNTVAVADTGNHRVRLYTLHGQRLSTIGMRGRSNGQFQLPLAVDVHLSNMLIIGDSDNNRIQVYNLAGQYIRTIYGFRRTTSLQSTPDGRFVVIAEANSNVATILQ